MVKVLLVLLLLGLTFQHAVVDRHLARHRLLPVGFRLATALRGQHELVATLVVVDVGGEVRHGVEPLGRLLLLTNEFLGSERRPI